MTQLLLRFGANANLVDSVGRSLVWHAAAFGNREILKCLLSHHGDPEVADSRGTTPLMISIMNRHPRITELLLEILTKKALAATDEEGTSALMIAAGLGDQEFVSQLLKEGCDPKTTNVDGHTALFFAHHGKSQLIYFLNKIHAKRLTGDTRGRVETKIRRYSDLIEELMQRGAEASHQVTTSPILRMISPLG